MKKTKGVLFMKHRVNLGLELFTSTYHTWYRSAPTQRFWFTTDIVTMAGAISNCF